MRIGIVGAGALGLYYGAMLQKSGQDVHFLMRRDYEVVSRQGLRVISVNGNFRLAQINCYRHGEDIGPVDLVIVGLKTFANPFLTALVAPLLGDKSAILTLQNGLGNEELLADAFGPEAVLGGVAFLCSNRGEPGEVHHLGEGKIRLGEYRGGLTERAVSLAQMFNLATVPCEAVSDLRRARWEKLAWNIPFNGLSALLNRDVAALLKHPPIKELIRQLMYEVLAGANAQSLEESIDVSGFTDHLIRFSEKMDFYQPSMMIDRLQGRSLELEAIYRIPLLQARKAGVEMPRIAMLSALLSMGENDAGE